MVLSRMQMATLDLERTNLEDEVSSLVHCVCVSLDVGCMSVNVDGLHLSQGAIALCEMVEFYGCATRLIFSANTKLRPRAWLTIGRMLKKVGLHHKKHELVLMVANSILKSPFISMIDVSYCALEEQPLTLLLRSVRANCCLQVLKLVGNNLAGKGTFILSEWFDLCVCVCVVMYIHNANFTDSLPDVQN